MTIWEFRNKFYKVLAQTYEPGEVDSFFRFLGEEYLGMSRVEMSLSPQKVLSVSEITSLEEALERLSRQEPIQYILGATEFRGLKFIVNPAVLIPRPETEELVSWILEDLKEEGMTRPRILDIGTGSGCIAISLAKELPDASITVLDISEEALETARANAELNGVGLRFMITDILQVTELSDSYDIIVSNPPYVRELEKEEIKANVLDNEPAMALFVKDENPLLFYDKITKLAQLGLHEKGAVYFEINQYLGQETERLLKNSGFQTELRKDFRGNVRMLKGNTKILE